MEWIYLFIASIFEIGWPVGLKLAQAHSFAKYLWITFSIITMAISGMFLFLAQKQIPIGTAYAIWSGIGTIGTFFIGIIFFNDTMSLMRFLGVILIISGVVILKLSH